MTTRLLSLSTCALALSVLVGCGRPSASSPQTEKTAATSIPVSLEAGLDERKTLDQSIWASEQDAQNYETFVVGLWDQLRAAPDKLSVLADTPFDQLTIPSTVLQTRELGMGITVTTYNDDAGSSEYTSKRLQGRIRDVKAKGYRLEKSEWHHQRFEIDTNQIARSEISFALFLRKATQPADRVHIKGFLDIQWKALAQPGDIRVRNLIVTRRSGRPGFTKVTEIDARKLNTPIPIIQPLITYDLNRDGLSEVILGGANLIHWNTGNGTFKRRPLLKEWPGEISEAALLADFTGDGWVDFLCVTARDLAPVLFAGNADGQFVTAGKKTADIRLQNPSVMTAGDIDLDGDLDLWVTQYRPPYLGGQMPTPYYDAQDGFPSYLLLNDGTGNFIDATEAHGLTDRRRRRTYSSSFVDLDGDRDLDLMVVSDFAGVDLYKNDGKGHFRDARSAWVEEWHNFGMAHTLDDFNLDGNLDFYVIGMSSTTARRLDAMKTVREDKLRGVMGYGNRMYLGGGTSPAFVEPSFRQQVARTGWSWGTSSFDLENDGDPDLYIANGHQSGSSTRDYCSTFWCHDIYTGDSENRPVIDQLLRLSQSELQAGEISWNGYEKNVLLLNEAGGGFADVAWLMDTALEQDCRGVVTDDLNGDGRMDLLVIEEWSSGGGQKGQVLHVFANVIENNHHWIAIRLVEQGQPRHAIGTTVRLTVGGKSRVHQVVNGDSFFSQHAPVIHFGLGKQDKIESIEVTWQGGQKVFEAPKVDQVLTVDLK